MIDNYIADFYCFKAQLVIELDGGGHYNKNQIEYDFNRTKALEKYNIKVLRFSNLDIDANFYEVCSEIDREVKLRVW